MSAILALTVFIFDLINPFQSSGLYKLISNNNTHPPIVTAGSSIVVKSDYSPSINAIQRRHYITSLKITGISYIDPSGNSGAASYSGLHACRDVTEDACDSQESERIQWTNFARILPEVYVDNLFVAFTLSRETAVSPSLVTGTLDAQVQYPAWIQLDRPGVRTQSIDGGFSFWVAEPRQAAFASAAKKFQDFRRDSGSQTIILWSGLLSFVTFLIAFKIKSKMPYRLVEQSRSKVG